MRVRWLRHALRNLDHIAAYIAEDDPAAAGRTVSRIMAQVENLAEHPHAGRPGRVPGTRELVMAGLPCIVPYRVRGGAVEVLRALHAAQRWPDNQ